MKTIKQILIYFFLIFMICPTNIFSAEPTPPLLGNLPLPKDLPYPREEPPPPPPPGSPPGPPPPPAPGPPPPPAPGAQQPAGTSALFAAIREGTTLKKTDDPQEGTATGKVVAPGIGGKTEERRPIPPTSPARAGVGMFGVGRIKESLARLKPTGKRTPTPVVKKKQPPRKKDLDHTKRRKRPTTKTAISTKRKKFSALVAEIFDPNTKDLTQAISTAKERLDENKKTLKKPEPRTEEQKEKLKKNQTAINKAIEKNKNKILGKITDEFLFKLASLQKAQRPSFYKFLEALGVAKQQINDQVSKKVGPYIKAREFIGEITEALTVDDEEPSEEEIKFPLITMTKLGKDYFVEELLSKADDKDLKKALKLNEVEIDVDAINNDGQTAMHVAINSGDLNTWNVLKSINYLISGEKPQLTEDEIDKLPLLEQVKYVDNIENLKSKIGREKLEDKEITALKSLVDLEKEEITLSEKADKIKKIFDVLIEETGTAGIATAIGKKRRASGEATAKEFEEKIKELKKIDLSKYFAQIHKDTLNKYIEETETEKTEKEEEEEGY